MPDYSFIAQPQASTPSQTIGNMLNIANQATALQRDRATLESDIAGKKAHSVTAQEGAKQGQIKTARDQFQFTGEMAQKAYDIGQGLVGDPAVMNGDAKGIIAKLGEAERTMIEKGIPEHIARVNVSHLIDAAVKDPQGFRQLLINRVGGGLNGTQQAGAMMPAGPQVTNNEVSGQMNLNPLAGPTGIVPGTNVNLRTPLDSRQTVSNNPVTQSPQVTTKDAFGNVQGVTQAPTGPGVPNLPVGGPQDIPVVTQMRSNVNQAAAQVPTQRFNNKEIIKLASDPSALALTGTGAEKWAKIGAAVGIPWSSDSPTNFQRLAHFMALQAQTNSAAMGAGTDAARSMAEQATGSTAWTPAAIISTVKVNDALATGLENFNKGMESAIKNSGGNVLAAREFQNNWSRYFDPDVYRYGNALQSGDKSEIDKILGKPGSAERAAKAKALAEKSANLNRLVTQGQ